jgi:hypothetical protein
MGRIAVSEYVGVVEDPALKKQARAAPQRRPASDGACHLSEPSGRSPGSRAATSSASTRFKRHQAPTQTTNGRDNH